jgi:Uma2 family endonuclease
MSILTPSLRRPVIVYPDSDDKPMADNTLQFRWIVTIKEGLERVFRDRPDAFVAGDLLWYPVEGHVEISAAPDAMVVFGRPKGDRGSYKQWEEAGIAPQVVFEVLSPHNRVGEMERKRLFYEQYGVQEYYIYDPDFVELFGHRRLDDRFMSIPEMNGWKSPLLDVRFELTGRELKLIGPDGQPFLSYQEIAHQRDQFAQERDQFAQERDQALAERDAQQRRADKMAEQLRSLGLEPSA